MQVRIIVAFLVSLVALAVPSVSMAQALPAQGPLGDSLKITPISGTQRILVIGCYFSDTDDTGAINNAMYGIRRMYGPSSQQPTIANYFAHVSNGRLQVQADVKGWYSLPQPFSYYKTHTEQQKNDCHAKVAQVTNLPAYNVVVMLFNQDTDMHNRTEASQSGGPALVYLRPWGGHGGWPNLATHAHELGHAFGLPHSATAENTDSENPYDNEYDAMSAFDDSFQGHFFWDPAGWCDGYAFNPSASNPFVISPLAKCVYAGTDGLKHVPVQYSAYQKVRLGWLSDGPQNTIMFYGGSDTYYLQAVGAADLTQHQMIAIPVANSKQMYTVEYRQRAADYYEQGLPHDAIVVYRIDPQALVPYDPNGNFGDGRRVAVLINSGSYTSPEGIRVSVSGSDMSQVTIQGPTPEPTMTSISPNYASSLRNSNIGYLPATVGGTHFIPSTVSVWPGFGGLWPQKATGGSYADSQTLKVAIPDSLLRQGRSAFVGVVNDQDDDPNGDGRHQPFWVSPAGVAPTSSQSATFPVTATAVAGNVSLKTTGKGSFAVASFPTNPGTTFGFASANRWFGALIGPASTYTQAEITDCDTNGGSGLSWWQGSTWSPVKPEAALDAQNCLHFLATPTSQPSLGDVTNGALFAVSADMRLGPVAAPKPINEGSKATIAGTIVNPGLDGMGLNIDWGDGNRDTVTLPGGAANYSVSHRYVDNPHGSGPRGAYLVALTLKDSNGSLASTASTSVNVNNVAPTLQLRTDLQSTAPNWPINLYVLFDDPGVYGTDGDLWTATVDWGDGSVDHLAVNQVSFGAQHSYKDGPAGTLGLYTIKVTVTDDDGGARSATTPITVKFGTQPTRITLCTAANYGGTCRYFDSDYPDLRSGTALNDEVSSIKITGPTSIAVYSDVNYQGLCETFSASDGWLGDNAIGNDTVSSVRVGVACQ